jgi:hypothetical protein
MNIQLFSNVKNKVGDENFNNKFVSTLPELIDGENHQKTIRVLNVSYPLTMENVAEKSCGTRLTYNFSLFRQTSVAKLISKGQNERIKYTTDWMYLPAGFYTLEKMIETLNMYVDKYDVHFKLMQGGRVGVSIHMQQRFIYRYQDNDELKEILYVSRDDNEISFELTKQLKYMLGLGSWVLHPIVEKYYALNGPTGYTSQLRDLQHLQRRPNHFLWQMVAGYDKWNNAYFYLL